MNYHPVFSRLPGLSVFRVIGFRYWRGRSSAIFVPSALPKPVPADPWQGFQSGAWQECADVEEFILSNYTPYLSDDSSLTGPTERTQALWMQAQMLLQADRANQHPERAHVDCRPNYLDRREELIVGLLDNCLLPPSGKLDCREVALYGAARLRRLSDVPTALDATATLAHSYGLDIEHPAANARQAIQWIYLALLAAYSADCNGSHIYSGLDTFLDVYLQRDIERGVLIEEEAQELIDDLVIKLRLMDRLHPTQPRSGSLHFPIAGTAPDGRTLVTRTGFRLVNTLYTLGPAAEPHFIVLWDPELPDAFRQFCVEVTIDSSSLRYGRQPLTAPGSCRLYTPDSLGHTHGEQALQLARLLDDMVEDDTVVGINVFRREVLEAALVRPNHYTCLTVQLADHAVDLQSLTPAGRKAVLYQLLQTLLTQLPAGG